MKTKITAAAFAALALAACAPSEEKVAGAAVKCLDSGFHPGAPEHYECLEIRGIPRRHFDPGSAVFFKVSRLGSTKEIQELNARRILLAGRECARGCTEADDFLASCTAYWALWKELKFGPRASQDWGSLSVCKERLAELLRDSRRRH